ncbi:hypothetical protein SPHINGOAX6_71068 [Sphingomonas sp. AX6]|nr:hypothetical protein SPHINGOAX6_71068 [Sphingomonas sp. AX6]
MTSRKRAAPYGTTLSVRMVDRQSDIVAERTLDFALGLLGLALSFLTRAFSLRLRIVRLLLYVANGFVDVAFDLVDEFTHDDSSL